MAERGQRTRLSLGGVTAEVALLKTSGKPREARHEVRRGDEPSPAQKKREAQALDGADDGDGTLSRIEVSDPFGAEPEVELDDTPPRVPPPSSDPRDDGSAIRRSASLTAGRGPGEELDMPIRHGVWRGEEWVDLTDELAAIDERTTLEGMELVHAIPSASVPRERVREAYWLATADPEGSRVLALLWLGLNATSRVGVVRWTKRTNQALGIIVPRSLGRGRVLVLLELEWADNLRPAGPRVLAPHRSDAYDRPITGEEASAASVLIEAFAAPPSELDTIRDERMAQRRELLEAAREGRTIAPASEPVAPAPEIAEAFAAAAAAR